MWAFCLAAFWAADTLPLDLRSRPGSFHPRAEPPGQPGPQRVTGDCVSTLSPPQQSCQSPHGPCLLSTWQLVLSVLQGRGGDCHSVQPETPQCQVEGTVKTPCTQNRGAEPSTSLCVCPFPSESTERSPGKFGEPAPVIKPARRVRSASLPRDGPELDLGK